MAYELNVNTGAEIIPIKDENGNKLGEIRFIPTDFDILKRFEAFSDSFNKIEIPEKPSVDDYVRITDEIKKQFDYLFNAPVSESLFGVCSPLTPLKDGSIYAKNVFEAISNLLKEAFKERIESARKIEEATKDYN